MHIIILRTTIQLLMNTKSIFLIVLLISLTIHPLIAQQLLEKTLIHDEETRSYTVYIPANYQTTSPVPLLFNFHGGSGDIASQISIADMRPIADDAGFILVYPQALPDPNAGGSTLWTHKEPTDVDDIFFVKAMINALASEYMIDQNRVYACGYSNGGEFSFELACRLSNQIAAIGVVARSMFIETYNQCAPTHPTGILSITGSNDDYDGITWGGITYYISLEEVNNYWSNFNNTDENPIVVQVPNTNTSDGSTVEHYSWNNGDGCVAVEHFKVNGGGHDWPGSFGNMDIDASLEIWNYVSQYDLNGLISCNTTNVENTHEKNEIRIFPNPVKNYLTLEMDLKENQEYQIFSTLGKLISAGIINSENPTIDLITLPSNIYVLKIGNRAIKFLK